MYGEVWLSIPSLPGCEASTWGRVRQLPYRQAMPHGASRIRETLPTFGYNAPTDARRVVAIRRRVYRVHLLVAEAFLGPRPAGLVVLHRDEDNQNNEPGNLKYGTQKENLNAPGFLAYCRSRRRGV